jgi:hypothetical protein
VAAFIFKNGVDDFRNGLECLWRLRKLKTLILKDMDHIKDLKLICLMLLDIFPDLVGGHFCSDDGMAGVRCYDHNFLRFSTIFGKKIGVFLKNQCYDQNFA